MKCDGSERLKVEVASAPRQYAAALPYSGMYGDDRGGSSELGLLFIHAWSALRILYSAEGRGIDSLAGSTSDGEVNDSVLDDNDRKECDGRSRSKRSRRGSSSSHSDRH